jgi:hypothetical protein
MSLSGIREEKKYYEVCVCVCVCVLCPELYFSTVCSNSENQQKLRDIKQISNPLAYSVQVTSKTCF